MCVMENAKCNALSSFWLSVFATCTLNYLLWIFGWFEYSAGVNSFFMVRKKKIAYFLDSFIAFSIALDFLFQWVEIFSKRICLLESKTIQIPSHTGVIGSFYIKFRYNISVNTWFECLEIYVLFRFFNV